MEGGFLIEDRVARARMTVLGEIRDRGYPFARLTTTFARDTRYLVFTVEKGMLCYVRNIKVTGLKRYRLRIVEREIKIARGEPYRVSKVIKSQRAIYGLGIFGYVDAAAESTGVDSVDLNFIVNEISPRVFSFGFGVEAPPEWVLNSIGVLASVGFEHLNVLNLGHTWASDLTFAINLKGEYDIKFEPRYTVPHVFGSQIYFLVHPFIQYESKEMFSRMTRGVEGKAIRFVGDYLQVNLANRYKYVDAELKASDTTGLEPALTNSVIANVIFDTRDDFFSPRRGIYVLPLIEDAGGLLGGDNHFYRLSGELRVFQPLVYGVTAFRIRVGRLYPRSEPVSLHEKFSLGGQVSVRGFDDKSIGPDTLGDEHYGNVLANANLEYRFDLYRNLGALIFCDIGDVRNDIGDFEWSALAKSVGAGLRYRTPVGPIRLDYGRGFGQGKGRFSFGFYNIF
jgi:outer membrane protein assembly factor BamA